jgi:hypothetical protein
LFSCAIALGPLMAGAIVLTALALENHATAQKSSFTQNHGVRVSAIVQSFENIPRCSKTGCSYNSNATVTLAHPILGGIKTTFVYYPGVWPLPVGSALTAVVDPNDAEYAEILGKPYRSQVGWIILASLAAPCDLLFVVDVFLTVVMIRRWYRQPHGSGTVASA